jgi:hypothetical protein
VNTTDLTVQELVAWVYGLTGSDDENRQWFADFEEAE